MCAVVTVGAVVGPTCGACAARARRWSTAYRRVPKRCAPKSWGLLCTKIINRAIFACFAPRKQVRVCKFHSFSGIFCFLLYTRAQKRASPTPSLGEWHRKWANRHKKTAKPPTDARGVCRRFGRWGVGTGRAVSAHCGVRQRHRGRGAAGLRLSGRCGR